MKMRPVGTDFFHADVLMDGRTNIQRDRTNLIVAFRNFANASASKKGFCNVTDSTDRCALNISCHTSLPIFIQTLYGFITLHPSHYEVTNTAI